MGFVVTALVGVAGVHPPSRVAAGATATVSVPLERPWR